MPYIYPHDKLRYDSGLDSIINRAVSDKVVRQVANPGLRPVLQMGATISIQLSNELREKKS